MAMFHVDRHCVDLKTSITHSSATVLVRYLLTDAKNSVRIILNRCEILHDA